MTAPKPFVHASFAGHIGVAREDITPPVGIYFRNWGAAKHDAAEGIHRPLTLTALTLRADASSPPLVLIEADMGSWWGNLPLERRFRRRLLDELGLDTPRLIFSCTHSHSAPPTSEKPDPNWDGGALLPAYLEKIAEAALRAARRALTTAESATLDWHTGRCTLATNRDLRHGQRIVCGYNPEIRADDTMIVGRVTNAAGKVTATLVNYACHPTTLAWQNRLISPDFVGTLRTTMQEHTGAPALFLQGASGELSPRYQYVGDTTVADSHGRQLAYAALATLEDMEPAGQALVYDGVRESGAPLATWKRQPFSVSRELRAEVLPVNIPLKDWPAAAELRQQFATATDRALAERIRRKLMVREGVGDGKTFPLELWHWRIGDTVLAGALTESYSWVQQHVRSQFPDRTIVWLNLINGTVGYLPPAALYDVDVYQAWQTPFDRGSLELLASAAVGEISP